MDSCHVRFVFAGTDRMVTYLQCVLCCLTFVSDIYKVYDHVCFVFAATDRTVTYLEHISAIELVSTWLCFPVSAGVVTETQFVG
jgi:hypothetical protein